MQGPSEYILLRAYLAHADRPPHVPTYQRLILAARENKLLGGTVLKGITGTGYHGEIKNTFWSFSEHIPIIVELLDTSERIAAFIRGPLDRIMIGGMLTLERAAILRLKPSADDLSANNVPIAGTLRLANRIRPLSTVPRFDAGNTGSHMTANENGIMLRIFIDESDRYENQPLYEAILQKVRETGLSGATVLRGSEGFGSHSIVHKSALLEMSTDLPIIVEIVDTENQIDQLLPHLEPMLQGGMLTMEYVVILTYRHEGPAAAEELPDHPDAMP